MDKALSATRGTLSRLSLSIILLIASFIAGIGGWVFYERSRARAFEKLVSDLERKGVLDRPSESDVLMLIEHPGLRTGWKSDVFGDNSFEFANLFSYRLDRIKSEKINDDDLARLGKLRHLKDLRLAKVAASTAGWNSLATLTKLEFVAIIDSPVDAELAPILAQWKDLLRLDLFNSHVSDETLRALALLQHLYWLDLSNTRITDGGMEYVVRCKKLSTLRLRGTQITDASVVHLKNLAALEYLELPDSISSEVVDELRIQLPRCRINKLPRLFNTN